MATDYKEKAKKARLKVLEMIHGAGTSHIASNFSIIDIATVLYENLKEGDEVVWSAGWKAATAYYFLAQQGKIPTEDLDIFGKEINGEIKYLGLLETTTPGIHANGGSMGHGLPIACGMALAKKLSGDPGKVYCIMSDGEMNEGTTWESAMFAAHHKLDNLVVIVDVNKWQAMGRTSEILSPDLDPIWSAFGFLSIMIKKGNDVNKIADIFKHMEDVLFVSGKPRILLCDTIKGKGVSFMEDHLLYHYKHVDDENYRMAKAELEA